MVNKIIGEVEKYDLAAFKNFAVQLVREAHGELLIRDSALLPEVWERAEAIEAIKGFLEKPGSFLTMVSHKDEGIYESEFLPLFKKKNPRLFSVLLEKRDRVGLYFWKENWLKPQLIISSKGVFLFFYYPLYSTSYSSGCFYDDKEDIQAWRREIRKSFEDSSDDFRKIDVLGL